MAKSNTIEIIRGIAQAAANHYDGAHDKKYSFDGEERKIGLKREEGDPIIDSRVINQIAKFLRKEYKKVTGNALTLTAQDEVHASAQNTSRVRAWVQAHRYYKIGGLSDVEECAQGSTEDRLDASIKKFLAIGKETYPGAKKPKNLTRKGEQ